MLVYSKPIFLCYNGTKNFTFLKSRDLVRKEVIESANNLNAVYYSSTSSADSKKNFRDRRKTIKDFFNLNKSNTEVTVRLYLIYNKLIHIKSMAI